MDILANFSVKLSQEQLTQLITQTVEKETGRKVKAVHWHIKDSYTSMHWRDGESTPGGASVTVDLGEEIVKTPYRNSSQFSDSKWEDR